MKVLTCLLYCALFSIADSANGAVHSQSLKNQEQRSIDMARYAIVAAILIPKTESGRYLCAREQVACAGVNQGELAVLLLSSRDSVAHLTALISAIRFATDAGLSELLTCKIGEKGKGALKIVSSLTAKDLRKECEANFVEQTRRGTVFRELQVNDACRTEKQLEIKLLEVKKILEDGMKCE